MLRDEFVVRALPHPIHDGDFAHAVESLQVADDVFVQGGGQGGVVAESVQHVGRGAQRRQLVLLLRRRVGGGLAFGFRGGVFGLPRRPAGALDFLVAQLVLWRLGQVRGFGVELELEVARRAGGGFGDELGGDFGEVRLCERAEGGDERAGVVGRAWAFGRRGRWRGRLLWVSGRVGGCCHGHGGFV